MKVKTNEYIKLARGGEHYPIVVQRLGPECACICLTSEFVGNGRSTFFRRMMLSLAKDFLSTFGCVYKERLAGKFSWGVESQ